jgi:ferric-chelate reductase
MSSVTLNATGVDFTNETQAFDFLEEILDDSTFQVTGNEFARYFWYGAVVVIGITAMVNVVQKAIQRTRYTH